MLKIIIIVVAIYIIYYIIDMVLLPNIPTKAKEQTCTKSNTIKNENYWNVLKEYYTKYENNAFQAHNIAAIQEITGASIEQIKYDLKKVRKKQAQTTKPKTQSKNTSPKTTTATTNSHTVASTSIHNEFKDKLEGKKGAYEQAVAEQYLRKIKQYRSENRYTIKNGVAYDTTTGLAVDSEDVEVLLCLGEDIDIKKTAEILAMQLKSYGISTDTSSTNTSHEELDIKKKNALHMLQLKMERRKLMGTKHIDNGIWDYQVGTILQSTPTKNEMQTLGQAFYTSSYICPKCDKRLLKANVGGYVIIKTASGNHSLKSVFSCTTCKTLYSSLQNKTLSQGTYFIMQDNNEFDDTMKVIDTYAYSTKELEMMNMLGLH